MFKLIETNLQKITFFMGGFLIFYTLITVNKYNQTYQAVLFSVAITIITFVLLVLEKNYNPTANKYKFLIIILTILSVLYIIYWNDSNESKSGFSFSDKNSSNKKFDFSKPFTIK